MYYSYDDFWNSVSLLSLIVGLVNLDENISQTDMDSRLKNVNKDTIEQLEEIKAEQRSQKETLTKILAKLEELQK